MIVLRDSPEAVAIAEKLVALHDHPSPEVMLEVEVLEVSRDKLTSLGLTLPDKLVLAPLNSSTSGPATLDSLLHSTSRTIGAALGPLTVNAKGQDTDTNLLANPRIRVKSRDTAKILIGDKVPNITSTATATGFVSNNVQYLDVGLKLDVTPVVTIDDEISMQIALEVSNIANQISTNGTVAYQIGTRSASTTLQLKDGENQILAGLIDDEARKTIDKFPGIGDLPLVGRLFSSHGSDHKRDEIVLSITPHLIRNASRPDAAMLTFDSGTETSLGKTSLSGGMGASAPSPAPTSGVPIPAAPRPPAASAPYPAQAPMQTPTSLPAVGIGAQPALLPAQSAAAPVASGAVVNPTGATAGATSAPTLSITGPTQVKVGETFTVQVMLNQSQPAITVANLNFALHYDPAVVGVLNIAEGNALQQGGAATNFRPELNGGTGQLVIADARVTPASGAPMTQGGSLLTLTLRALRASDATPVAILSAALADQTGAALNVPPPASLSVTVTP